MKGEKTNNNSLFLRITESFVYAFRGIKYFIKSQHNAVFHTIAAILVVFLAIYFNVSLTEWCLLFFAIGIVFIAEIYNTAIEFLEDFISTKYNEKAGKVKDIAAAGVLAAAVTSAIIGLIIFIPRIIEFFS